MLIVLTDNAEREFAHAAELSNQRRVLVTSIVDGQPVVGAVLVPGAYFAHRAGHDVFASALGKVGTNQCNNNCKKGQYFCRKLNSVIASRLRDGNVRISDWIN